MTLTAVSRDNKKPNVLRAEDLIPAEFFGPEIKNQSLAVPYNSFAKVLAEAGESSLVDLILPDGKKQAILIGEVQMHPTNGRYTHVDLRQVSMTEKIEAHVELKFVGRAPALDLGGVFVANKSTLTVKALPSDLVKEIEVDVSSLADFDSKISVADIKLPAGIEAAEDATVSIASIARPMAEEAAPAATTEAEKAAIEAVEVEKKGKEETEEEAESAKK